MGGVPVRELVATLRRAAGIEADAPDGGGPGDAAKPQSSPEWLDPARVAGTVDADALLDAGQVPLTLVSEKARTLGPGQILRVDSGFRPVPLVEALAKLGFRSFVREAPPGRFETIVSRG